MTDVQQVISLTEFQRNTEQYIKQIRESQGPMIFTINENQAIVVEDFNSYQKLMNELEYAQQLLEKSDQELKKAAELLIRRS